MDWLIDWWKDWLTSTIVWLFDWLTGCYASGIRLDYGERVTYFPIQNPQTMMSLKISEVVGIITGCLDIPPYVTSVDSSSINRVISLPAFPPTQFRPNFAFGRSFNTSRLFKSVSVITWVAPREERYWTVSALLGRSRMMLMVRHLLCAAIWITAWPTALLAPFCTITSPSDKLWGKKEDFIVGLSKGLKKTKSAIDRSIDRSLINQSINHTIHQFSNQPIDQSINRSNGWSKHS